MISFIKKSLSKTVNSIKDIAPVKKVKLDKDVLEEILIQADLSYDLVEEILNKLPSKISKEQIEKELLKCFSYDDSYILNEDFNLSLIIGINGAGKTTSIAKLANIHLKNSKTVMFGAGDTFRAGAIKQLSIWADKLNVPIIKSKQGHDPSAIVYDCVVSAKAKKIQELIIDTAGRLHNNDNLSKELKKIVKIAKKALNNENELKKILVIDGTQGNSVINQAKAFNELVLIDAIIITKLDGTAKGGSIFSIANELKLPIIYLGVGEGIDDLVPFDKNEFISSILDEIYEDV